MLGLGQVPVSNQEAHAARVALQALDLRGYAGIGQLSPDELFFESQRQGAFEETAFPGVPSLEGILAAALAGQVGLGARKKKKGFFGGITKFAGPVLSLATKNAGILSIAGGAVGIPPGATSAALKALDNPKIKAAVAKATVSTRALERGGAPIPAAQRQQAAIFEDAILKTPGGGAELAQARVGLFRQAQQFGQGDKFAALSKPTARPCGFFGRLFRRC